LSLDIDVELMFVQLNETFQHCIIPQEQKPGFVHIKALNQDCDFHKLTPRPMDKKKFTDDDGFLLPYNIKEHILVDTIYRKKERLEKIIINLQRIISGYSRFAIKLKFTDGKITKATSQFSAELTFDDGYGVLAFSIDIAAVLKITYTSDYIKKWSKRKRIWPDLNDLKEELSNSYVIAKPSKEEKSNGRTREFRYSFGHIERKIISLQSIEQRLAYYVTKIIFYQWLKPFDDEKMESFFL